MPQLPPYGAEAVNGGTTTPTAHRSSLRKDGLTKPLNAELHGYRRVPAESLPVHLSACGQFSAQNDRLASQTSQRHAVRSSVATRATHAA